MSFAFFDLDDTLLDTAGALHAWSRDFVAEYALGGAEAARAVFEHVDGVATWAEFAVEAQARYGIDTPVGLLLAQIAEAYPLKFALEDAVATGLDGLRAAGCRLGVITNGGMLGQRAKVEATGLGAYLDAMVDSESAGTRKPDRRIFETAARELGVDLGPEGWMVGDLLETDIKGGLAAGLRTIWLTRGRALPPHSPRPQHCAASIAEAIEIILTSEPAGA